MFSLFRLPALMDGPMRARMSSREKLVPSHMNVSNSGKSVGVMLSSSGSGGPGQENSDKLRHMSVWGNEGKAMEGP